MPVKDRVIAYEFLKEFLELMKTGKDNNDEDFRKKSEWLEKEDKKLYSICVFGYSGAKNEGMTPKTVEELAGITVKLFETYSNEISKLMSK